MASHGPYDSAYMPEVNVPGGGPGTSAEMSEYLRRTAMASLDRDFFMDEIKRRFPDEPILVVRYGDHQPDFAADMIDPNLDERGIWERLASYDPRYYTTYYAIDVVNFKPMDMSSALDTLEGPYLPLVIQEAAGLPLDPSFVEQKKILSRCAGLFYACKAGAEARRFTRLLIDAGLINGL